MGNIVSWDALIGQSINQSINQSDNQDRERDPEKFKDDERVAIVFVGEGGAQNGRMAECLNAAAKEKLPLVFVSSSICSSSCCCCCSCVAFCCCCCGFVVDAAIFALYLEPRT